MHHRFILNINTDKKLNISNIRVTEVRFTSNDLPPVAGYRAVVSCGNIDTLAKDKMFCDG